MALEFLRRDCSVINEFFSRKKVYVLTTKKFFKFVTDESIKMPKGNQASKEETEVLNTLLEEAQKGYSSKEVEDDKVFEQVYIPRSLQELDHVEIIAH